MPDWSKEIRAAIARLNMDPARGASLVEELSRTPHRPLQRAARQWRGECRGLPHS